MLLLSTPSPLWGWPKPSFVIHFLKTFNIFQFHFNCCTITVPNQKSATTDVWNGLELQVNFMWILRELLATASFATWLLHSQSGILKGSAWPNLQLERTSGMSVSVRVESVHWNRIKTYWNAKAAERQIALPTWALRLHSPHQPNEFVCHASVERLKVGVVGTCLSRRIRVAGRWNMWRWRALLNV